MTKDEALKLALDALSPDPYRSEWIVALDMDKAITAIKEALAQQEQKPVAWMYTSQWKGDEKFITRYQSELMTYKADKVWPLYTTSPPCQTCEAMARTVMMDQTGRDA